MMTSGRRACARMLAVLFLSLVLAAEGRHLLQFNASECDLDEGDRWQYEEVCQGLGSLNPTLPPRWAGADNFTGYNIDEGNPFLVRAAQGGGVSGGSTLGFRTGGAQDIENMRENIRNGFLPLPTDVLYEGIVKDYYFDTSPTPPTPAAPNATAGEAAPIVTVPKPAANPTPLVTAQSEPSPPRCNALFCPIYSLALTPDPLLVAANESAPPDIYLAVGLDSGIEAASFKRKRLNIVLVLDVSGSMSSPFDQYYYDAFIGKQTQLAESERNATKIDVAKEVLSGILGLLNPDDRFGLVLFSDSSCEPKPLGLVRCLNMSEIQADIKRDLEPIGSTNTQEGYDRASFALRACKECIGANPDEVENRIILITDAQPNQGGLDADQFRQRLEANARDGVYTTTYGIGLDFNTEFIELISKVKGANYYSVHSPGEFKRRLVDDFDFAVTPLVFDLSLRVDPASLEGDQGWKILHVYGSPNPNDTALAGNGTIMNVNTLFPSPKTEEGIKGGVVLLRMHPPPAGANTPLQLSVNYTGRAGSPAGSVRTVGLPRQALAAAEVAGNATSGAAPESTTLYQSTGVRKAVVLARYVDLLRNWLFDQWAMTDHQHSIVIPAGACAVFPSKFCLPQYEELYGLERNASTAPLEDLDGGEVGGGAGQGQGLSLVGEGKGGAGPVCMLERWLVPGACILPTPQEVLLPLGRWERTSEKLVVNEQAKEAIRAFLPYMQSEIIALGDASMEQEIQILLKLLGSPSSST